MASKVKIKEIKSKVKVKEIKKEVSMLEREVDSDSFTAESSASSDANFVPSIKVTEVAQETQIVREIREERKVDDSPQFSESARYNITNTGNVQENRSGYNTARNPSASLPEVQEERVFRTQTQRIDPSLRQDNFRNTEFNQPSIMHNDNNFVNTSRMQNDFENRNYEDRINQAFDEKKRASFRAQ